MCNSATINLLAFINEKLTKNGCVVESETLLFKDKVIDSLNILALIGYIEYSLARTLDDREIVMQNFESVDAIVKHFFEE